MDVTITLLYLLIVVNNTSGVVVFSELDVRECCGVGNSDTVTDATSAAVVVVVVGIAVDVVVVVAAVESVNNEVITNSGSGGDRNNRLLSAAFRSAAYENAFRDDCDVVILEIKLNNSLGIAVIRHCVARVCLSDQLM
jgi:hypothetical protein